jgi:hypothetical protein
MVQSASQQKIVEENLPKLLKTISARQGQTALAENDTLTQQLRDTLKPLFESAGITDISTEIDRLIKDINTQLTSSDKGLNLEELSAKSPALLAIAGQKENLQEFIKAAQTENEFRNKIAEELNAFANALNQATEAQIKATNIRLTAENQIKEALGKPLSLNDMVKPIETEIMRLTSTTGANGQMMNGTLNPAEIQARIDANTSEKNRLENQLSTETDPQKLQAVGTSLARVKSEGDNLAKAQQRLANDTTRAAAALSKLQDLTRAKESTKGGLFEILGNISNPEAQLNYVQQTRSLQSVMGGRGGMLDIEQAIPALQKALSYQGDPEKRAQMEDSFLKNVGNILARNGMDPNLIRDVIKPMLSTSVSPEQQALIDQTRAFTEAQAKASELLGTNIDWSN